MSQTKDLITYESENGAQVTLSPQIVRQYLVNGQGNVTDQEVMMFVQLCKYQGLNPFLREAYLIKYGDRNPATIVVGKEVFTKRAERHPDFRGFEAGVTVMQQGGAVAERKGTIVLKDETIVGGWAKVYRKDYDVPIESSVNFDEYVQRRADGSVNQQWSTKPATMIRKCALVAALREAFPAEFGGMYAQEEINTIDSSALPEKPIDAPHIVEEPPDTPAPQKPAPAPEASKPASGGSAKPISDSQVALIKRLMRENNVPDEVYRLILLPKTSTKELTSSEASKVIDQLKNYSAEVDELPFD